MGVIDRPSLDLEWRAEWHPVDRARTMPGPVRPLARGEFCRKCYAQKRCRQDGWCWRSERARLLLERRRRKPTT